MKSELSEDEFLEALGGGISVAQLERWRGAGLLPATCLTRVFPGGGGSYTMWDSSCLDQVRLIDELLKNVRSISKAAKELFGRGYVVAPYRIRDYLDSVICTATGEIKKQRKYLSDARLFGFEKRDSLDNYLERKLKGRPSDVIEVALALSLGLGQALEDEHNEQLRRIAELFSPESMQEAIEAVSDDDLVSFALICTGTTSVAPAVWRILELLRIFKIADSARYFRPLLGYSSKGTLTPFHERRAMLLWFILIKKNGVAFLEDIFKVLKHCTMKAAEMVAALPVSSKLDPIDLDI